MAFSLVAAVRERVWFCTVRGARPWERPSAADVRDRALGGHTVWYDEPVLLQVRPPCPTLVRRCLGLVLQGEGPCCASEGLQLATCMFLVSCWPAWAALALCIMCTVLHRQGPCTTLAHCGRCLLQLWHPCHS